MTQPPPLTIDGLSLRRVGGGRIWLDGGTMFGVVPKPLWERKRPADARNRVEFDCNCLLVETAGLRVLIDTGYGSNPSPRQRQHQGLDEGHPLLAGLADLGIAPEQIDAVLLTHLHFDHAGGCTFRGSDGTLRPAFPRARHLVQASEWDDATSDRPELAGNYPPENFLPLRDAGLIDLIEGDRQVLPGISVRVTGGHTRGHQAIYLGESEIKAVYPGDLCPTSAHLPTFWALSYDQFLLETRRAKPGILGEAADRGWPMIFDHDPAIHAAIIERDAREDFVVEQALRL